MPNTTNASTAQLAVRKNLPPDACTTHRERNSHKLKPLASIAAVCAVSGTAAMSVFLRAMRCSSSTSNIGSKLNKMISFCHASCVTERRSAALRQFSPST